MEESLDVKVEVKGEAEVKRFLASIGLSARDLRSAMNEVGRGAVKTFSGPVFTSRGQFIGESWPQDCRNIWASSPRLTSIGHTAPEPSSCSRVSARSMVASLLDLPTSAASSRVTVRPFVQTDAHNSERKRNK